MFRPDRRWFTIASIALLLGAVLHTWGQFQTPPANPGLANAVAAMRGYQPVGRTSLWDVYRSVQFTMSVLLFSMAVLDLAVAGAADASTALVRRLAALNALGLGALVALYAFYRVPPPLVIFALIEVLFLVAWFSAPRRAVPPDTAL